MVLNDWHPGELAIQRRLGFAEAVTGRFALVEDFMRDQHRIFHTSNVPFIPITTTDNDGRPWASLIAGPTGQPGFVQSKDARTLTAVVRTWEGDPLIETIRAYSDKTTKHNAERFLIAGLGIDFTSRRRNKFAGRIRGTQEIGDKIYELDLEINEALGNCPKYINVRQFITHPETNPAVSRRRLRMDPGERLPDEVIQFITNADTVFVGSVYNAEPNTAAAFPSHVGMNARGGLPGFMRVQPSDGRSIVLPDYSGNRFLSSLGNIESSGLVGLTMVSFTTGDVLYVTGNATTLVGEAALKVMVRHATITVIEATGFTFVRDALPIRQIQGSEVERSPYSPKIKYLVGETQADGETAVGHKAKLETVTPLSSDLAIFTFHVKSKPGLPGLRVKPGQAIVLDFMDWIGPPRYSHMADSAPGSINDDRVRTWTISSAQEDQNMVTFDLTMRKMQGGAVTGALFDVLNRHRSSLREALGTPIALNEEMTSDIVGISGDLFLNQHDNHMLWAAGGIGITPFLAMLAAMAKRPGRGAGINIILALATREPFVMLSLVERSLQHMQLQAELTIDLFTQSDNVDMEKFAIIQEAVHFYKGRIPKQYWTVARDRDVFICGPSGFGDSVEEGLKEIGVPSDKIVREGFY